MIRICRHIISKPNVRKSLTDLRGCFISLRNLLTSTPTFNYKTFMSVLLPKGSRWKGKVLSDAETLSPLAESLIIEKWLYKIHPNLSGHVKKTRGYLFSKSTPTLGCSQKELCKQIDIMRNEMKKNKTKLTSVDSLTLDKLMHQEIGCSVLAFLLPVTTPDQQ